MAQRGVALYEDKIFVPIFDGRLVALNAETGAVVWSVQTTPPDDPYQYGMGEVRLRIGQGEESSLQPSREDRAVIQADWIPVLHLPWS